MKLPWILKYGLRKLFGELKGNAIIAWLEGPAGAAIDATYGSKVQQLLDSAEAALIAEVAKVEADLNRERERLVKEHPEFFRV